MKRQANDGTESFSGIVPTHAGQKRCRGKSAAARRLSLLAVATAVGSAAGLLGTQWVHAATDTWTGATSSNWTDSNWSGSNNPPQSGDALTFSSVTGVGGLNLSDNLMTPATFNVGNVTFASGAAAFVISPATANTNGFTLTAGIINSGTSLETINDLITLGSGSHTVTTTTGGGNLTLGGNISGAGSITASGATLILSGVNSFTGGVTLGVTGGGGTLDINSTTALGAAASSFTIFTSGVTIDNTTGFPETLINNNPILFNNTFSFSTAAGTANNSLNLGNGAVSFNATRTITLNGAGNLTFGGALTNTGSSNLTLTVNNGASASTYGTMFLGGFVLSGTAGTPRTDVINGTGIINITGPITDVISGTAAGNLTYSGTGMLILSAANTYSGLTKVSSGTVQLGSGGSMNSGSALTVSSGATFDLNGSSTALGTVTNSGIITSSSSGGSPTLTIGNGANSTGSWTGAMNVIWNEANATGNATGSWTNTGNITLNANGTGNVTLSSAVNNTGTITNSGTGNGLVMISGTIGAGVSNVTQNSASSPLMIYNDTNTSFAGTVTVTAGTLEVKGTSPSLALNLNNVVAVGLGGTIDFQNIAGTIAGLNNISGSGGTVTDSTATLARVLTLGGSGNYSFGGVITAPTAFLQINVNLTGNGTQTFSGNNTYTGLTTVSEGTLLLASANAIKSGNPVTTSGLGILDIGGNSLTLGTVTNNGTITNGGAAATLTIGSVSTGSGVWQGNTSIIWNQAATTSTIVGTFANTGNLTLNTTGTGSINVGTANNTGYIVNSGTGNPSSTITTVGANVLGLTQASNTSQLVVTNLTSLATTLTSTGNALFTISNFATGTGNATFSANSAGGIKVTNGVNISGNVTNSGTGNGTVTIGGLGGNVIAVTESSATSPLTFNGLLTVNGNGTMLTNSNASGSALLNVQSGVGGTGALILDNNSAVANGITIAGAAGAFSGNITNSGTGTGNTLISAVLGSAVTGIIQNSPTSTLTLTGNNTYTGITTISAGTLQLGNNIGGHDGSVAGNITNNAALAYNYFGNNTYSGVISGTGTITVSGSATSVLTLSGNNTYSGGTTVNAGALAVTNTTGSATGNGTVSINSSGMLSGTGTMVPAGTTGTLISIGAAAQLAPSFGAGTTTGTLNANVSSSSSAAALNIAGGAILNYNFAAPGTCDLLAVTGNVTLASGNDTLNINQLTGYGLGNYTLITATNLVDNVSHWTLLNLGNYSYAITGTPTALLLSISPSGPATVTWSGNASASWNTGSANWQSSALYADNDLVVFDDSANGNFTVDLGGATVNPGNVTVNNSLNAYTIGNGTIGGNASLTKMGSNTLTLTGANLYAGGTTVNAGTLMVAAATNGLLSGSNVANYANLQFTGTQTLGTITGNGTTSVNGSLTVTNLTQASLVNNGAVSLTGSDTISNAISGSGNLTVTGSLMVPGTFAQAGLINNGTVQLTGNGTIGQLTGTGTLTIGNGSLANTVTLAPASTPGVLGGIKPTQGLITIASGSTLDISNNAVLLNYGNGTSPLAAVVNAVAWGAGNNGNAGNASNGAIVSGTVIAANANSSTAGKYAVGYADHTEISTVPTGNVEVAYTLAGDANLDGSVDILDYQQMAPHYDEAGTYDWSQGDFNHDGHVDILDYQAMAPNYDTRLTAGMLIGASLTEPIGGNLLPADRPIGSAVAADGITPAHITTAIPEPASLSLLLLGSLPLLQRRRQRTKQAISFLTGNR